MGIDNKIRIYRQLLQDLEDRERIMACNGFKDWDNSISPFIGGPKKQEEEKETTMQVKTGWQELVPQAQTNVTFASPTTLEEKQKEYLITRLAKVYRDKKVEMNDHFQSYDKPHTLKEMKRRLKDGEYTIDGGGYNDDYNFGSIYINDWFSWRTKPYDAKAHDAAIVKLNAALQEAEDQARLFDNETGLKALQKFEKATFH